MTETTHEVLVAARNRLATRGWSVDFGDEDGPNCAIGAIRYALGDDAAVHKGAESLLADILGVENRVAHGAGEVGFWNDAPGRTEAEVLALFDSAIATTAPEPDLTFVAELRDEVSA